MVIANYNYVRMAIIWVHDMRDLEGAGLKTAQLFRVL